MEGTGSFSLVAINLSRLRNLAVSFVSFVSKFVLTGRTESYCGASETEKAKNYQDGNYTLDARRGDFHEAVGVLDNNRAEAAEKSVVICSILSYNFLWMKAISRILFGIKFHLGFNISVLTTCVIFSSERHVINFLKCHLIRTFM